MRLSARSTIFMLTLPVSLVLTACGGGSSGGGSHLAAQGEHHTYVIDSVLLPMTSTEATAYGFDLDGDSTIDNQLGNVLSSLSQAGAGALDLQGDNDEAVDMGDILLLADIDTTALTSAASADFRIYYGANANPAPCTDITDMICRHHLLGNASFDVDPASPNAAVLGGSISSGNMSGGSGDVALQISIFGTVINMTLVDAHVEINGITTNGFAQSKIGGVIPDSVIQNDVLPAFAVAINNVLSVDCPAPRGTSSPCNCAADSTGATLMSIFDEDNNCDVPEAEILANSLTSTLWAPDVDTNNDNTPDAFSVGVGVTAVKAAWTVP